jgi:hypothetical protein
MQISLNNISQLDALLNKYKRFDFVFEFSPFSPDENQLWQAKIKDNYFACGCNMGRMFLMWGLLATVIGLLTNYFYHLINLTVMDYVYLVLFVIVLSGIGKAVGKQRAYKILKNDITELKSKLK